MHPCSRQGQLWGQTRVLRALSSQFWGWSQPSLPGQPVPLSTPWTVFVGEKFYLPAWTPLVSVHACSTLLPCCTPLWRARLPPPFHLLPLGNGVAVTCPWSHFCPRLDKTHCPSLSSCSNVSALSVENMNSLQVIGVFPALGGTKPAMMPRCGQWVLGRGDNPCPDLLIVLLCCSPGCCRPSLLPGLATSSSPACCPRVPSLEPITMQPVPSLYLCKRLFLPRCSTLHFSSWISWGFCWPVPPACLGGAEWQPFHREYWPTTSNLALAADLMTVCSTTSSRPLITRLSSTGPRIDPAVPTLLHVPGRKWP